jgi:hypothetical protein
MREFFHCRAMRAAVALSGQFLGMRRPQPAGDHKNLTVISG